MQTQKLKWVGMGEREWVARVGGGGRVILFGGRRLQEEFWCAGFQGDYKNSYVHLKLLVHLYD